MEFDEIIEDNKRNVFFFKKNHAENEPGNPVPCS